MIFLHHQIEVVGELAYDSLEAGTSKPMLFDEQKTHPTPRGSLTLGDIRKHVFSKEFVSTLFLPFCQSLFILSLQLRIKYADLLFELLNVRGDSGQLLSVERGLSSSQ